MWLFTVFYFLYSIKNKNTNLNLNKISLMIVSEDYSNRNHIFETLNEPLCYFLVV